QNNGYHPQWQPQPQPGDGRHAPMHTSYTQGYNARMTPRVSFPEPGIAQLVSMPSPAQYSAAMAPISENVGGGQPAPGAHLGMSRPALPPKPASLVSEVKAQVQRRNTIFDNPNYGFTGPAAHVAADDQVPRDELDSYPNDGAVAENVEPVDAQRRRRRPPKVPLPIVTNVPEQPAEYVQQQQHVARVSKLGMPPPPPPPHPNAYIPPKPAAYVQQQQQQFAYQQQQQLMQQQRISSGNGFYNHPVAAGSDPSLNGRMHAGNNLRSSILYQTDILPPEISQPTTPMVPSTPASGNISDNASAAALRRRSQLSDTAAYGATGLKNFGNTCFMNCVIQCLVGTAPFARYFMQGGWKKDMVGGSGGKAEVTVEFARLVDNMWRGQYGSISPIGFRSAVGKSSEVFKGNDQEDAHEFATFLLDTLHESLNRVHPRPKPERELTAEEEMQFEALPDIQQAEMQWGRYIRRNWSIMTSIFQGQSQSRLTCLTCSHTSTTYHTFTELSVPIPTAVDGGGKGSGKALVRKAVSSARNSGPVNIYHCLDEYSKTEILDGDNRWQCPKCKTKRRASKQLLVSRLPLVLIVHLKRFLTIGHFREKLETNVLVPTRNLYMDRYAIQGAGQTTNATSYNLYGVANHFGTMSGGHYTASVFSGLRGQWNYFDDTRVSIIPENNVTSPAAYLLFFVQNQQ
ncbi:ubiquitin-specific protease doa4, partial [Coemansia sp. RSA 1933]